METESAFVDLQEVRTELESIEYDLETEQESYTELEAKRDELEKKLNTLDRDKLESPDRLEGHIQELRARKRSLDTTVSELQSMIRFNEERLDDGFNIDLEESIDGNADICSDVTNQLLADSADVICWICGT